MTFLPECSHHLEPLSDIGFEAADVGCTHRHVCSVLLAACKSSDSNAPQQTQRLSEHFSHAYSQTRFSEHPGVTESLITHHPDPLSPFLSSTRQAQLLRLCTSTICYTLERYIILTSMRYPRHVNEQDGGTARQTYNFFT